MSVKITPEMLKTTWNTVKELNLSPVTRKKVESELILKMTQVNQINLFGDSK